MVPQDKTQLRRQLKHLIRKARLWRFLDCHLTQPKRCLHDFEETGAAALALLWKCGELNQPLNQTELAKAVRTSASSLSQVLRPLAKNRLCRLDPAPVGRRGKFYHITNAGKRVVLDWIMERTGTAELIEMDLPNQKLEEEVRTHESMAKFIHHRLSEKIRAVSDGQT